MLLSRSVLVLLAGSILSALAQAEDKPNILWIFAEDTSPWMGCYGDSVNEGYTPHIDSLADQGTLFSRAYVPAPVCSACRSSLMGGQNQIRFGAHEHRSSRGPSKNYLPKAMKLLPQIMKEGGYYTFNLGKDDYNFVWDKEATYSLQQKARSPLPWDLIKENQPFYGQIQTAGGKQNVKNFPAERKTDPASVTVPPDYPQNQLYREVVAEHYDSIRKDDNFIGEILAGLKESGLWENTIVVYVSDHGANNLARHKQMPTEGGLHVPLIVRAPEGIVPKSQIRDDLVNVLDLSATTLAWAGLDKPDWYEGQDLFGEGFEERDYVASAKDRLDFTIDRVRTLRTDRFRYTRNYKLDRVFLQPQYRDTQDYTKNLRELYANGELTQKLKDIYFGERSAEELYDLDSDPHQLDNLAGNSKFSKVLEEHRLLLEDWVSKGDMGAVEESDAEMLFQTKGPAKWRVVNPEYEVVREDSDGDGLSDDWEGYNDRDPNDGKLLFTFDCGGWQTEGWEGNPGLPNIAGYQGFLDFELPNGEGSIVKSGLNADLAKQGGVFSIDMRVSESALVWLSFNSGDGVARKLPGPVALSASGEFETLKFQLPKSGLVKTLRVDFSSDPGAFVEIDSMKAL